MRARDVDARDTGDHPMPLYEYRCRNCNHQFEIQQSFSDDALTECPECSGDLRKVFNPVGISFKGSGFYKNDSRGGSSRSSSSGPPSSSSDSSPSDATSTSTGSSSAGAASTGGSKETASSSAGAGATD